MEPTITIIIRVTTVIVNSDKVQAIYSQFFSMINISLFQQIEAEKNFEINTVNIHRHVICIVLAKTT